MFFTIQSIAPTCRKLHASGHKLVLATGFFDLLHSEHIIFLQKARAAGDILVVGVESDTRARAVKGEGRPVESQKTRAQHVAQYANYTILLPDDFDHHEAYASLLAAVKPAIYAVSSHTPHQDKKRAMVEAASAKLLVVHRYNPAVSTTKILASQKQL